MNKQRSPRSIISAGHVKEFSLAGKEKNDRQCPGHYRSAPQGCRPEGNATSHRRSHSVTIKVLPPCPVTVSGGSSHITEQWIANCVSTNNPPPLNEVQGQSWIARSTVVGCSVGVRNMSAINLLWTVEVQTKEMEKRMVNDMCKAILQVGTFNHWCPYFFQVLSKCR